MARDLDSLEKLADELRGILTIGCEVTRERELHELSERIPQRKRRRSAAQGEPDAAKPEPTSNALRDAVESAWINAHEDTVESRYDPNGWEEYLPAAKPEPRGEAAGPWLHGLRNNAVRLGAGRQLFYGPGKSVHLDFLLAWAERGFAAAKPEPRGEGEPEPVRRLRSNACVQLGIDFSHNESCEVFTYIDQLRAERDTAMEAWQNLDADVERLGAERDEARASRDFHDRECGAALDRHLEAERELEEAKAKLAQRGAGGLREALEQIEEILRPTTSERTLPLARGEESETVAARRIALQALAAPQPPSDDARLRVELERHVEHQNRVVADKTVPEAYRHGVRDAAAIVGRILDPRQPAEGQEVGE